jgi:hypothetical protein
MNVSPRIYPLVWVIVLICACAFLFWVDRGRLQRVEYVSGLAAQAGEAEVVDAASPTGYAGGHRELIVPERNEASLGRIAQTQQMFARREWRVHHVDYDNAPLGRAVEATSPYRWWLGLVAWVDHAISGRPVGLSVERAALYADPLLHGLMLVGATVFVAWRFGVFAAGVLSLGLVGIFPFAAGFLPGVPDPHGLARIFALGSLLVLLAGLRAGQRSGRWFALAGVMGGLGVWVDVPSLVPFLAGVFLGALIATWFVGRNAEGSLIASSFATSWRAWSLGGAGTILAAYLIEYYPGHLVSWHLGSVHPLYGFAWLGCGELLARAGCWGRQKGSFWGIRNWSAVLLSLLAIAAVPAAISWSGSEGFLGLDFLFFRLSNQPNGIVSTSLGSWMLHDGISATVLATLLPLMVLVPAGWLTVRGGSKPESRILLAVAWGPVLVAFGFASLRLCWWDMLDGALLVLMVAAIAGNRQTVTSRLSRWLWSALTALIVLPGLFQLLPGKSVDSRTILTGSEAQELIERHLAHWLARRTEEAGAVVYAPPHETTSLCFFGGFRGVGTFAPENRIGFGVTLMIAAANTIDEAEALIQTRGVRYIIVPSWDPFFDEFAHLYLDKRLSNRTSLLVGALRRWNLPLWVRPVPYHMLEIPGFEGQSVLVFEVVEKQSPAVAASRLAEYFVEMNSLDQAAAVSEDLRRFPGDVCALTARAQVQKARGDTVVLEQTLTSLLACLANGGGRFLPWDRRVSLAVVLAQAGHISQARDEMRHCMSRLNEKKLRFLSPGLLYNFQVLSQAFELPIADPRLRQIELELLPPE